MTWDLRMELSNLCYGGRQCVLMPPQSFLQRPVRWLQAISHYKATISGGPNFAYEMCARKITPEQRDALDLSNWNVAYNGAEPVRADTMERFAATFASCGFRPNVLLSLLWTRRSHPDCHRWTRER